jgi:hypothetical protein
VGGRKARGDGHDGGSAHDLPEMHYHDYVTPRLSVLPVKQCLESKG